MIFLPRQARDIGKTQKRETVFLQAFERGRRLVDSHVELNFANLWGWMLPWSVVFLSPRHLCESSKRKRAAKTVFLSHLYIKTIFLPRQARDKHKKSSKKTVFLGELWSDNFGDWPPAQPSSSGGGGSQGGDGNDDDDDEAESAARRGCCAFANRCWIPWRAIGGPHTWYYRCPVDGTLVQRRRVFSRLLVQFRVDDPGKKTHISFAIPFDAKNAAILPRQARGKHRESTQKERSMRFLTEALGVENRGFVRRLASRHLAASGGGRLITPEKTVVFFECFPHVCPEPVLVNDRFLYINGSKTGGQAKVDLDGKPVSHSNRAKEQSSQFVFLKLFKVRKRISLSHSLILKMHHFTKTGSGRS
eukprot:COSAG06_NODE_828_length_12054_cov_67.028440_11_plen_361_part_00